MKNKPVSTNANEISRKLVGEFIRDVTQVTPRPKSEVRRRLNDLLYQSRLDTIQELKEKVEKMKIKLKKGELLVMDEKIHNDCIDDVLSTLSEMEGKV